MTKFKKGFLILYLMSALSSIFMIYYQAILLETVQNWGYWLDLKQLPMIGPNLTLILAVLMLFEIIVQKLTISKLKNIISEQKDEVMSIKSKLYDQITNFNNPNTEANDDQNQPSLEENEEY